MLKRGTTWMAVAAVAAVLAAAIVPEAAAYDCGSACRQAFNQCRIKTKDASSCESEYTSCLQSCRKR